MAPAPERAQASELVQEQVPDVAVASWLPLVQQEPWAEQALPQLGEA